MTATLPPLLPQRFYRRDALAVAYELIGALLVRDGVTLRITEVEAYRVGDSASHCRAGKTARNGEMWGPPGRAYVYRCYGIHQMLNVVTDPDGVGSAILVRSAEIVAGADEVVTRRRWSRGLEPGLLSGPGRVGQALGLDAAFDHHPLFVRGGLELRAAPEARRLLVGPRVGIDYATPADRAAPWRWSHRRSSSRRPARSRRRRPCVRRCPGPPRRPPRDRCRGRTSR
jgi:DNA-3-methyladenine glycosylase